MFISFFLLALQSVFVLTEAASKSPVIRGVFEAVNCLEKKKINRYLPALESQEAVISYHRLTLGSVPFPRLLPQFLPVKGGGRTLAWPLNGICLVLPVCV